MKNESKTMDANEAVASVAYRLDEVIAIYPITPSFAMGEWADQRASEGVPNIWGPYPTSSRCKVKAERPEPVEVETTITVMFQISQ